MNENLQLVLDSVGPLALGAITGTIPLALASFANGACCIGRFPLQLEIVRDTAFVDLACLQCRLQCAAFIALMTAVAITA